MPTPIELLENTIKIFEQPDTWTTHVFAKDVSGMKVQWYDPEAACFCSLGALMRSIPGNAVGDEWLPYDRARLYVDRIAVDICGFSTVYWNDNVAKDQSEVLEVFKKALELAKKDLTSESV